MSKTDRFGSIIEGGMESKIDFLLFFFLFFQEEEKRKIMKGLNAQTAAQFQQYAAQQHPGMTHIHVMIALSSNPMA